MIAVEPAVSYDLEESGPTVFQSPPSWCWWCGNDTHPRGWRACPLVVVDPGELSAERRRLRSVLS